MKKIISYICLVAMIAGLFANITVFATEDITADPMEFLTSKKYDKSYTGTDKVSDVMTSSGVQLFGASVQVNSQGYIEYTINTETAKDYLLTAKTGTTADGVKVDVSVGGTVQIDNVAIANNGSVDKRVYGDALGVVSLAAGSNVIRFENVSSNIFFIEAFTLKTFVEDITSDPMTFPVNKKYAADYTGTDKLSSAIASSDVNLYGETIQLKTVDSYIEYTINTMTDADYLLTVTTRTELDNLAMDVSVNGTVVFDNAAIPNNGSYDAGVDTSLGTISLTTGENKIRFTNVASGKFNIGALKLKLHTEDITANPMEFATNKYYWTGYEGTDKLGDAMTVSSATAWGSSVQINAGGYIEYTINTKIQEKYRLAVKTRANADNLAMDVSVNGTLKIDNAAITNNNSTSTGVYSGTLGTISLGVGENTIRFENVSSSSAFYIETFKLQLYSEDILSDAVEFSTRAALDVTNDAENGVMSSSNVNLSDSSVTINADGYIEYTVNTKTAAEYILTAKTGATAELKADIMVNEALEIDDAIIANNGSTDTRVYGNCLGIIPLSVGENKIRFTNVSSTGFSMEAFMLTRFAEDITGNPTELFTNKTIDAGIMSTSNVSPYASCVKIKAGGYIEYTVRTKTAMECLLAVKTRSNTDSLAMDVSVNGVLKFDNANIPNNGSMDAGAYGETLGLVPLNVGGNTIRFENVSSTEFSIEAFRLTMTAFPVDGAEVSLAKGTVKKYMDEAKSAYAEDDDYSETLAIDYYNSITADDECDMPTLGMSWNAISGAESYTLYISRSESFPQNDTLVFEGITGTSYDVYNLYVNTKYYWKVVADNGTASDVMSFTTADTIRFMKVDGMRNVRDIGGWNGLNQGLVYRGSEMNGITACSDGTTFVITEEGKRVMLEEMGIKTDIDLRASGDEQGNITVSPLGDTVTWVNSTLGSYTSCLKAENMYKFKNIFSLFANSDNYPIYFHCFGGADRTGTVAFLIEALAGASEVDLNIDFETTTFAKKLGYRRRNHPDDLVAMVNGLKEYEGDNINENVENYALAVGATRAQISNIRSILAGNGVTFENPCDVKTGANAAIALKDLSGHTVKAVTFGGTAVTNSLSGNVLNVDVSNAGTYAITLDDDTVLEFDAIDSKDIKIESFEIQNADGSALSGTLSSGASVRAVATLQKLEDAVSDKVYLMVAEYNGDVLVNCKADIVDFATLSTSESDELEAELTLENDGATVKAFLIKADTLIPLTDKLVYPKG